MELAATLIVVIPMFLVLMDLVILAIGATLNDSVCRDAARAASAGPPANHSAVMNQVLAPSTAPYQRAVAVVKNLYCTSIPAKVRDNPDVIETLNDVPPDPAGGAVQGEILVRTTVDVYPLFLVRAIAPCGVTFSACHTVPYTYVVPAAVAGSGGAGSSTGGT